MINFYGHLYHQHKYVLEHAKKLYCISKALVTINILNRPVTAGLDRNTGNDRDCMHTI